MLGTAVACALPAPAAARDYAVALKDDALANGDGCSLREAIRAASTNAAVGDCPAGDAGSADTIALEAGTYRVTRPGTDAGTGDLDVAAGGPLAITGAGAAATAIAVDGAADRVLDVVTSASVTIARVTIRGGRAPGGIPSSAPGVAGGRGADGGGVRNGGTLTLTDVVVTDNVAGPGAPGTLATGTNNQVGGHAGPGGTGGGIHNDNGTLTLTRVVVTGNRAGAGGNGGSAIGFGSQGSAPPGHGTGGNAGAGGAGGGIAQMGGSATIEGSTISANSAGAGGNGGNASGGMSSNQTGGGTGTGGNGGNGGNGGGIAIATGSSMVRTSALVTNTAGAGGRGGDGMGGSGGFVTGGGMNGPPGGPGMGGGGGMGGSAGAAHFGSPTSAANVTFDANSGGAGGAGGAARGGQGGNGGSASGQPNTNGGNGGAGGIATGGAGGPGGGAALHGDGATSLTHATLSSNAGGAGGAGGAATSGLGGAGGAGGQPGGAPGSSGPGGAANGGAAGAVGAGAFTGAGIRTLRASLTVANTPANCVGTVQDGGGNATQGDATCPGTNGDAKLGPLQDNGEPTPTRLPGPGSVAIDAAAGVADCLATDQRGSGRPKGVGCDAGAVEVDAPAVVTGDASALTQTGATLSGSVQPGRAAATYRFEYGTTTAHGSATPDGTVAAGAAATPVSAAIAGLAPNTTYHYRLVATSAEGESTGADRTFTTPPPTDDTVPDTADPLFSKVSMTNTVFAVDPRGKAEKSVKKRVRVAAAKKGTTFRYTLSEVSRVVFTIERKTTGRRVGKKCRKRTRSNAKSKRCTLWVRAGRFAVGALAGANTKTFSGRIGKTTLSPGSYRAVLVATDVASNASKPATLGFRIVRK